MRLLSQTHSSFHGVGGSLSAPFLPLLPLPPFLYRLCSFLEQRPPLGLRAPAFVSIRDSKLPAPELSTHDALSLSVLPSLSLFISREGIPRVRVLLLPHAPLSSFSFLSSFARSAGAFFGPEPRRLDHPGTLGPLVTPSSRNRCCSHSTFSTSIFLRAIISTAFLDSYSSHFPSFRSENETFRLAPNSVAFSCKLIELEAVSALSQTFAGQLFGFSTIIESYFNATAKQVFFSYLKWSLLNFK